MAAAYAALLSLFHTLNHIKIHPRPPISLDQSQVESLTQNLTFLLHFLERYPSSDSQEDDDLESRITTAAHAVEDVIETHIVDQIHARSNITTIDFPQGRGRVRDLMRKKGMKIKKKVMNIIGLNHSGSTGDGGGNITSADLYEDLERAIQDMELIKRDVVETIQKKLTMRAQDADLNTNSSSVSGGPASTWQSSTMQVFDDAMIYNVLDKLVGQQSALQMIPIVGMGGIGKTTLAKYIYEKPLILQHFDTPAWVTISQEYSRRDILQQLYQEVVKGSNNVSSEMSEDEIGLVVYQHLFGRRYFIVLDDIWSVEAWYKIKSYFPDNNNGSRIMITTRLSNLAIELSGYHGFQMQFLDEYKSWDLLCEIVFGKLDCPTELENIGKEIATKCRGLPLSIDVVGGLLRKSNMTQTYWMYTLENLSFIINLENDEYTLRILRTSYKELPMHLKPCFLYIGIFPEDKDIKMSMLIRLWVAEGILKPVDDKTLEEVAKEYLKELIDRNLILVSELRWNGEARLCKIHDLLRDVCLREAKKQKFFCVLRQQKDYVPQGINMERRICINTEKDVNQYSRELLVAVESTSLTRSFLYTENSAYSTMFDTSLSLRFRLLRVFSRVDDDTCSITNSGNSIFEQANLRYLSLVWQNLGGKTTPLGSLLWDLQTLKGRSILEIWKMPLLRHVMFSYYSVEVPDPPNGEDNFVLKNLQTLSGVLDFKFSKEVVKRIPNIKKLKLKYGLAGSDDFCLHNLGRLQKLEDLSLAVATAFKDRRNLVSFPHSLKKLTLRGTELSWKELTIRIGSLPLLQLLKLDYEACRGAKWETVEGQFCSLRFLEIHQCIDLQYWETDCTHFPRLESLDLILLRNLKDIPLNIGDIPTLKRIKLSDCRKSVLDSVERIKEDQAENGNEDLQVVIDDIYYFDEVEEVDDKDSFIAPSSISQTIFRCLRGKQLKGTSAAS